MAVDIEKLVVSLSADVKSYENAMKKATATTTAELKRIRTEAAQTGGAAAAGFEGASRGVTRFGNQARHAAANARALTGQTGNLAAQFQDIAVMWQAGQSPLTTAIQQGTQLTAVFGQMGARGAVAALGSAFASIVNPVSLATIAIIAAGGYAVQYFATLFDGGEKSAEELKKQADLVRKVADEWGDALPALQAYLNKLDEAGKKVEAAAATEAAVADIWAEPQKQVEEYALQLKGVVFALQSIGDTDAISRLRDAFQELQDKTEDETASGEDAMRVHDTLNQMLETGGPLAQALAAHMLTLAGNLDSAAGSAARLDSNLAGAVDTMRQFRTAEAQSMKGLEQAERTGEAVIANMERRNSLTAEQLALEDEIARVQEEVRGGGGVIDPATATRLAEQTLAAEKARAAAAKAARGGGSDKAAKDAERERKAVIDLIDALLFEQSLIGATNLEREIANNLRKAGAAATAEQRAEIEAIVTASQAEIEALRSTEAELERLKGLSKDVLGGMFEDLRDGASAAQVLANALNRVAESFVTAGIDRLIEATMSGGGGGGGSWVHGGAGQLQGGWGQRILSAVLHEGGIAGIDGYGHGRSVPASTFAGARRYHRGGFAGLVPGEVPAILKRGEAVGGAAGGPQAVHVTVGVDVDKSGNLVPFVTRVSTVTAGHVVKKQAPGVIADTRRRVG